MGSPRLQPPGVAGAATDGAVGSPELFHSDAWAHSLDRPGTCGFACAIPGDEGMVGALAVVE